MNKKILAILTVAVFGLLTTGASANVFTAAPEASAFAAGAASIQAADTVEFGSLFFDASGTNYQDNSVTIAPGQTVDFSFPVNGQNNSAHNVVFGVPGQSGGAQPTSCVQTAAPSPFPILAAPPLPAATEGPGWAGSCTFNTAGTYTFYCQAHNYMTGTVTVAVPANNPPTVTASRNPSGDVTNGTSITFTAVGADADSDPITYAWDFGDGGTSTSAVQAHSYATPGDYAAKVTVSDGKGGSNSQTLNVHVTQANRAPTVTAARTPTGNVAAGTAIAFTATGTDADSDTLTYSWDFGDSTAASTQQNPSHTYANAGNYTATVTVNDGKGGTGTNTVAVAITGGNANPTVTTARTPTGNVPVGIPVSFTATAADADGDPLSYSWNFGDGTPADTTQNPTHTFTAAATRSVTVTVTDGRGGTVTSTPLSVVVSANRAPTISAAAASVTEGIAPLAVHFTSTGADADGQPLTYAWDLDGDGTFETGGQNPDFTYNNPTGSMKSFAPVLRVSDNSGGSVTRTLAVNVFATGPDPSAKFNVLLFSKTAAFRHTSIPAALTAIKKMGVDNNFSVDATEDGSNFNDAFLNRYDVVAFVETTGDVLTDPQQAAFQKWYEAGHGYVGIHSATDTEYTWPWYGQLTGAYFRDHPNGTPTATVVVEDTTDPSTQGLPARWVRTDEWYNFQTNVNPVVNGGGNDYDPRNSGVHVLLKMDESTYVEGDGSDGVDDDHPISWCNRFDGGRMFYTAMGHTDGTYSEPGFVSHLLAGFQMTAGTIEDQACGKVKPVFHPTRTPAGSVDVNVPITFDSGATTVDGDTLTYAWDFGDGSTSTDKTPTHAYTAVGNYTAKVTVTSPLGTSGTTTYPVTVTAASTTTPGNVGADVPFMLALTLGGPAGFGPLVPGVAKDYTSTMAATVTSTAGEATLSVVDPDTVQPGKLVNGTYVLASPLQIMATNAANPTGTFAPVAGAAAPVTLLTYPRAISSDQVSIGFKQSVADTEILRAGNYAKTLTFTLSTATP